MKVVKIFAVAAASIAALLVIAAVIVAWLFDPNDYKDYITAWLEEQTGRSWVIEDDLELGFFPWLAVETGGISIGNAPGFEQRPMATIDAVSARVRLVPLLKNEIDIGTVLVDGLELELARDAEGRGNWEDLIAGESAEEASEPGAAAGAGIESIDIEGLALRGARVVWRENADEPRYVVSELSLQTGSFSPAQPVDIELGFELLDIERQITAETRLETTLAIETDRSLRGRNLNTRIALTDSLQRERARGDITLDEFTVTPDGAVRTGSLNAVGTLIDAPAGPAEMAVGASWEAASLDPATLDFTLSGLSTSIAGIVADWQLAGTPLGDAPGLNGSVRIMNAPAASMLELLGVGPPAGADPGELGNFSASTNFTLDLESWSVQLGNSDATLLGINLRADRASVEGDSVEATIAVAPFRPNDATRAILAAYLPDDVDTQAIERLSLRADLTADLDSGAASLRNIQTELLGAVATGEIVATPTATGRRYAGRIETNRFAPNELMTVLDALLTDTVNADELGALLIAADFSYDSGTDRADLSNLRLEAFGLQANGDLAVRNVSTNAALSGHARVADFPPRELLRRFGQTPPAASDDSVLRNASIDTQFNITPELGRFSNLVLVLDDSRVSGDFSVDNFEDPSYRFNLTADVLDVDRYLPPQTDDVEDGERRAGDLALENEPLETLQISGRVNVALLRIAQMNFQNVATDIAVGSGRMILESARADLYGGDFEGAFRVDTTTEEPSLTLQGRARELDLEPLIRALTGDANFSGRADFDIDLTGYGATVTETLHTAAGEMGFSLRNGAIDGFNVEHKLCGYYNYLRQLPEPDQNQPERTPYQLIQGTAMVSNGIATSNDLLAEARNMQVRGTGRLSLPDQLADYAFEARFTGSVPIAGCGSMDRLIGLDFPLTLTGPVTDPTIEPDYSEILERWARDEIEDRVREELQDRLLDILR